MSRKLFFTLTVVSLVAVAIGCGKHDATPVSPSGAVQSDAGSAADGSTLKATAPTPVSPVNGVQLPTADVTLTISDSQLKYGSAPLSYRFQVFNASGAMVYDSGLVPAGKDQTSHTVTGSLDFNSAHTWRARPEFGGAFGPWSSTASFKTASGGYIKGSEIYDPLTNGKTVGQVNGTCTFSDAGVTLPDYSSHITYQLQETLTAGEYSFMATNIDRTSRGEKSKVMMMQEGYGDPTNNDYRFGGDFRAKYYPEPGAVTGRVITGSAVDPGSIRDFPRLRPAINKGDWYLWKLTWDNGWARLQVLQGGPNGAAVYDQQVSTNGHPYRPEPHVIHIGAPIGRGGETQATVQGLTVKNLWVSSRPRPANY